MKICEHLITYDPTVIQSLKVDMNANFFVTISKPFFQESFKKFHHLEKYLTKNISNIWKVFSIRANDDIIKICIILSV